ncbi:Arf-GAP domain and FG repeat-containing protein 1 [Hondaea fermentalgiana]|uniref:Arf-GAP domain and FG repeat-containing protein 1 n=1 Tax=Hondaea fermentalgiana TaxID=2315210 RepID=A0A2R5GV73_9STRA|nr:Arf-GAP domain and FG repeat-containing protein 1 [Hondaea fermentalgiana]|eukprot:GBG34746.1 Arf-GAP domain and FG repeat-containing protein 1 [Hondaea fermentalgiana]
MGGNEAETLLNKLRKLGANRECVNCKAQSRLGFGAICVKYGTFVCNYCKSSHQAYSHRVKSATMSTWTMPEVEALRKRNGGGNECARAIWYAKWTPKDEERYMPREGDKIDRWKELIVMVYEEKRWYDPNAELPSSSSASKTAQTSVAEPASMGQTANLFDALTIKATPASQPAATNAAASAAAAAADEIDLFGGSTFDAPATATTTSAADVTDLFADFDTPSVAVAPASSNGKNGNSTSAAGGFSFISPSPAPAPQLAPTLSFQSSMPADDPFAVLHQPAPSMQYQQPQQVAPSAAWPQQQQQLQSQQPLQSQLPQQQFHQQVPMAQVGWQTTPSDDPFASLHASRNVVAPMPRAPMPQVPSSMPAMGIAQTSRPAADPNDPFAGLF